MLAKMDANFQLVKAVQNSDLKAVKKYLKSSKTNADIDCLVKNGSGTEQTPLMFASRKGKLKIAEYLVEMRALLDLRDGNGKTALMLAAEKGEEEVAQFLAHRGADLEIMNNKGKTALMLAAERGHGALAQILAQRGADLDVMNDEGKTALMLAAERGHGAIEQILANFQLVKAVVNSDLKAVKKCLESPNVNAEIDCSVKLGSGLEQTPLMFASHHGELLVVQYLVQAGANMDIRRLFGETALMLAAEQGHNEVVQFLVKQRTDLEISAKQGRSFHIDDEDYDGRTALMLAAENGHDKVVEFLAELGADKVIHHYHIPTSTTHIHPLEHALPHPPTPTHPPTLYFYIYNLYIHRTRPTSVATPHSCTLLRTVTQGWWNY